MDFKVERGIKIPLKAYPVSPYPLHTLLVDESFFVPDGTGGKAGTKLAQSISAFALQERAKSNKTKRFVIRQVREGEETGVRVWRKE